MKRKAAAPPEKRNFLSLEFGLNELIGLEEKGKRRGATGRKWGFDGQTSKVGKLHEDRTMDGNEGDAEKPASGKQTVTLIGRGTAHTDAVPQCAAGWEQQIQSTGSG